MVGAKKLHARPFAHDVVANLAPARHCGAAFQPSARFLHAQSRWHTIQSATSLWFMMLRTKSLASCLRCNMYRPLTSASLEPAHVYLPKTSKSVRYSMPTCKRPGLLIDVQFLDGRSCASMLSTTGGSWSAFSASDSADFVAVSEGWDAVVSNPEGKPPKNFVQLSKADLPQVIRTVLRPSVLAMRSRYVCIVLIWP